MISGMNIFLEHIYDVCEQRSMSLEQALCAARGFGYSGLECDLWRLSQRQQMRDIFANCGIHTESIYCGFDFACSAPEKISAAIENCLDAAEFFGAKKVLALTGFAKSADEIARVVEGLSDLCEKAKRRSITVTVEDFDDYRAPCSTAKQLLYLVENVDGLGITFDTGNFAYSLENPLEVYGRLSGYIKHVHLKDRTYAPLCAAEERAAKADISGRNMYPCAVGAGEVGVAALLEKLLADGYCGSVSAEHFGAADQLSCMEKSAQFIAEKAGIR